MDIRLILDSGKQQGRETRLARGVYLVGRSQTCQIRPKNKSVSRKHCAIINNRGSVVLQDIGSKTGTFLNGERLEEGLTATVSDGDELRVGRTRFRFAIEARMAENGSSNSAEESAVKASNAMALPAAARASDPAQQESMAETEQAPPAVRDATGHNAAASGPSLARDKDGDDNGSSGEHFIDNILDVLESEESDVGAVSGVDISPASMHVEIDLEDIGLDDADSDVDFAAPRSSESLSEESPVPSYQLRQDWDVNSVHNWVGKKSTLQKELPKRKFKPKNKKAAKAQSGVERERQERIRKISGTTESQVPPWLSWLDSDTVRPVAIGLGVLIFLAWVAYNVWKLYSFEG